MLKRLYVHNFRCLENFELKPENESALLLLGKNGSGKSTIAALLKIIQATVRGQNRVSDIISLSDFAYNRTDIPIRIEIDVLIEEEAFVYTLLLELPENSKEPRVAQESLTINDSVVFSREKAQITLFDLDSNHNVNFSIDWHLFGLPVIQERNEKDPIAVFKAWLARMVIISPIPALIKDQTNGKTLQPEFDCSNFAEWLAGLLAKFPASYTVIDQFLRQIMPDLKDFTFNSVGGNSEQLLVRFSERNNGKSLKVSFNNLSDGEKCMFIGALVTAANEYYGPLLCFWDEPDNYLALREISHFILALRRAFDQKGQLIVTSHNIEAIERFSDENTLSLKRASHLEPVIVKRLSEIKYSSLYDAIKSGEI